MERKKLRIGDQVIWTSSGLKKAGQVIFVVPAGKTPQEVGYGGHGFSSIPRDHETYIVRGGSMKTTKRTTIYWPFVSLLLPVKHLTEEEIRWCHENVNRVRAMIAGG